ncbi:HAD family hydrolase [Croceibacterium salegens]|uniref:HAD family hydrolase n=1 Tax=Croceibacterium salegens TaxID=1737568 RepID=UPI002E26D8A8
MTRKRGPDFVPPEDRIATFDNDGTLWCERPLQPQFYFAKQRLEAFGHADPALQARYPFKAFFDHDIDKIKELGKQGVLEVVVAVHAGVTADKFDAIAGKWLREATNPKLGKRFVDLVYKPQLELLDLLRDNEFRCFIVSGGGMDVIRGFSEEAYGIPRENVIGSSGKTTLEERYGRFEIVKQAQLGSFDDREVKPQNIYLHIGRRPILAFGNSDGDLAMLRYTLTGGGPALGLLLHHDDAEREFAYDREFILSPLADALDNADNYGLTLVSMKDDWEVVFPG